MIIRSLAVVTGVAMLSAFGCEDVALPVEQTIQGPVFEYTIPAGKTSGASYTTTVQNVDVAAELENLGIDQLTIESISAEDVKIEISEQDKARLRRLAFESISALASRDAVTVTVNGKDAAGSAVRLAGIAGAAFAGWLNDEAAVAQALAVVGAFDARQFEGAPELVAKADIDFGKEIELDAPINIKVSAKYKVKGRVSTTD